MLVFLIGFMGSGKSRIGRELAMRMGLQFFDLDRVIEQRVGPITPYFQRAGEASFRQVESETLTGLLEKDDAVIATGGGTPFQGNNMKRMKEVGTVVYLDLPPAVLIDRLKRKGRDRPLLFGLSDAELELRVGELFQKRRAGYEEAHLPVDATGSPEEVAERIRMALAHPR